MNNVRVLRVESHREYLDVLNNVLETTGYDMVSATTARQALSMLVNRPVDGVLVEYDLPDASGAAVRAKMKRIKPEVPVLLFARVGSQARFLLRFFDPYLRNTDKPECVFRDLDDYAKQAGCTSELC